MISIFRLWYTYIFYKGINKKYMYFRKSIQFIYIMFTLNFIFEINSVQNIKF